MCFYYSITENFTESADVVMYPPSPAYADLGQPLTLMCKTNITDLWKSTSIYDETNSNGVPNVLYFEKAVDDWLLAEKERKVRHKDRFCVHAREREGDRKNGYFTYKSVLFKSSLFIYNLTYIVEKNEVPSSNTILITANPTGPINSGDTLHVTCSLSGGNPLAILTWNCSGTAINKSSEKSAFLDIALTVGQQDDGTICTCFASHRIASYNATAEKVISLKVYFHPEVTPTITQVPEGNIDTGDLVLLNCTLNGGNPVVTLSWNCSGNNHVTISGNTVVNTIEFNVNSSYHNTVCTCLASQDTIDSYSDSASHMLNVIYPPESNPTIHQATPGPVDSGSSVSLIYSLSGGNPLASLTWDCKGITQNSSSNTKTEYIVTFTVNKTFNGRVCTCFATHPIDSYRPNVQHQLAVYYAPGEPALRLGEEFPWFEGNTVIVNCLADVGNPEPVYKWMIGKQTQMQNNSRLQIEPLSKTHNDQEIKCSVNNDFTLRNNIILQPAFLKLNVEYNTSVTEVDILNGLTFPENVTAILRCQVTGNPLPNVTWYFISDETKQILQREDRIVVSSYIINTTSCLHTGTYECATENTVNGLKITDSKQTDLKVTCSPRLDNRYREIPATVTTEIGNDLNLTVFLVANPPPRIPTPPVHINIICKTKSLHVLWVSEFNGGREQTFFVEYWISLQLNNKSRSGAVMDLGESTTIKYDVKGLLPRTNYSVRILASNANGISVSEKVECITDLEIFTVKINTIQLEGNNDTVYAGIAMLTGGVILSVVIALAFLIRFRRNSKQSV
ncbi:hemicentin-1-like [Mytilus trossulus]|uniref:hemicentin-1-like n=1 Tax=Mytilus trossulus TaxID=6551 RepID=UPI0030043617